MKKILAISLAAALLLLAGCSGAARRRGRNRVKVYRRRKPGNPHRARRQNRFHRGLYGDALPTERKIPVSHEHALPKLPLLRAQHRAARQHHGGLRARRQTFGYTDQAIRVTGTLRIEDYTDEYGYVYNYRIADASYEIVDLAALSEDYALWQSIASDGVVAEINSMFDYLHFLCQWTEYQSGYTDDDGSEVVYFLYPGDVEMYLQDTGPYSYAQEAGEDYFPGLIERIRAISANDLEDLVTIVESAQQVAATALSELRAGNYTYDSAADKYALQKNEELYNAWYDAYSQFALWLAKWEI